MRSIIFFILFIYTQTFAIVINHDFDRKIIYFPTDKEAGSIVIKTYEKKLYYILGDDLAYEFPIAVGKKAKDRFYGIFPVLKKVKWPSWRPTPNMIEENPSLPEVVYGGKHNPLGARALYLGDSPYRIHGTNNPNSIGKAASHGCIRMFNEDVKQLFEIVNIMDTVYVE